MNCGGFKEVVKKAASTRRYQRPEHHGNDVYYADTAGLCAAPGILMVS